MTPIIAPPRLTRDERLLLAAISKHLRADGWKVYSGEAEHRGAQVSVDWLYDWTVDGKTGRVLQIESRQHTALRADVNSVREAVDVAVAVGLLPQGMSSAFRAAMEAPRYTAPLDLRADQVDIGWLLLDARTEADFHLIDAVTECEDDHTAEDPTHDDCVIIHSTAYSEGLAHCPPDWTVTVRIPAGDL